MGIIENNNEKIKHPEASSRLRSICKWLKILCFILPFFTSSVLLVSLLRFFKRFLPIVQASRTIYFTLSCADSPPRQRSARKSGKIRRAGRLSFPFFISISRIDARGFRSYWKNVPLESIKALRRINL